MPLRRLREAGHCVTALYSNSNIAPEVEYRHRLSTFANYAKSIELPFFEDRYAPEDWQRALVEKTGVFPLIEDSPSYDEMLRRRQVRCRACYRLRFMRLAHYACERDIPALASSLSVSPWQFTDLIAEELRRAAALYGRVALFEDYRKDYPEATRLSRDLGMYRQNYCGCAFSRAEAERERAARKARRQTRGKEQM